MLHIRGPIWHRRAVLCYLALFVAQSDLPSAVSVRRHCAGLSSSDLLASKLLGGAIFAISHIVSVILGEFYGALYMVIGGFYAVLLFRQHAFLRILMRSVIWYSLLAILGLLLGFGVKFSYFHYEIYALLFGGIILHLAANPHLGRCMEHTSFHYLGKISYGLYMYHPIAIVFALQLLNISTMASVTACLPFINLPHACLSRIIVSLLRKFFYRHEK